MAKKKVMLFIVEGPTDETSLSTVLNRIFSSATVKFQVIHGDILTRDFTSSDKIELIRQVEINIDYILMLVMKYHESNCKDKSILGTIDRAIDSSIQLRSKKDLIHGFISTVNAATDVDRDWQSYVQQQKQQELEQIIAEEKLKPAEAQRFVANAFRDGALNTTGTDIDQILPPVSRFGGGNRTEKKKTIIQRLAQFFEKYFGI